MKSTAIKLTAAVGILLGGAFSSYAQNKINVVTTAVPFLRISPDARAGGMGDLGLATSPDAASQFYNLAKLPFNTSEGGASVTYTPWLKKYVNDVFLAAASGYYKFDENQALSLGLRYFNLGDIQFTDNFGNQLNTGQPREFSIEAGYSRKLSQKTGIGIAAKYIRSNLANGTIGGNSYKPGSAVAADLSFYHNNQNTAGQGWAFGAALTNLGSKIAYTDNADQRDFIPANFGIGTSYTKVFDESNKITFGLDLNKLLVPTPPNQGDSAALAEYRQKSVIGSWFSSFGDAPDGFSEEVREFQVSLGAEYWYNNQFAVRLGYFHEDKTKGNRRFVTAGVGVKYNVFGLNFSYLASTGGNGAQQSPLANTLRFSLVFDFGAAGSGSANNQ
jgi:hypothetical protein